MTSPGETWGECGCESNEDCGLPQVCEEGMCQILMCTNNEECAGTRVPTCWSWQWYNYWTGEEETSGYCVGCIEDSNCEDGGVCYNTECMNECNPEEESPCGGAESCQDYGTEGICVDCSGSMGWYCTWEEDMHSP